MHTTRPYSHYALGIIPHEEFKGLHSMFEDTGLDKLREIEQVVEAFEQLLPNHFIMITVNGSVSHSCIECDYYDPYWATYLVTTATWGQYREEVDRRQQEWEAQHPCTHKEEHV